MRRLTIIFSILALIATSFVALFAPAASAATQCRFAPVLPKKLSVGQAVVGLTAKLKASGRADCSSNSSVTAHLVHGTDDYSLFWDGTKPEVESVYAFEVKPGVYRTTAADCDAYDDDYNSLSCSVAAAAITIKFTGRPRLTATRSGSSIKFKAVATRYFDYDGFQPTRATVLIQRYTAGKWKTVHSSVAAGKAGYSWTYAKAPRAKYRAVSAETAYAFSGATGAVTR